jgi:hypothetical protein
VVPRTKPNESRVGIVEPASESERLQTRICIQQNSSKLVVLHSLNDRDAGNSHTSATFRKPSPLCTSRFDLITADNQERAQIFWRCPETP